jgi:predicted amidohydrolase
MAISACRTETSASTSSTGQMLVAVAQIRSTPSIARNLVICRGVIDRAAKKGAKLVYLPEASDFVAPTAEVLTLSSPLHSNVFVDGIKEQAKTSGTWVGVGIHERPVCAPMKTRLVLLIIQSPILLRCLITFRAGGGWFFKE